VRRTCWIGSRAARRRTVAGGKGAGLAKLRALGCRVPDGFVITTAAFREFSAAAGLDGDLLQHAASSEALARMRARVTAQPFPPRLAAAISASVRRLGGTFAVRSSLIDEDGAGRSFAGQLESVLAIEGEDACLAAVKRVYASLFAAPVASYLAGRKAVAPLVPTRLDLAVVVQRMVPARASGVAFSADPVTGERQVVVEAVVGLGDRLMRGAAAPARFVHDSRNGLAVIDRRDVSADVLPDDALHELATLVRRIASRLEAPQDVEWAWDGARLAILQTRPITGLRGRHDYSRRLVADMSPGLVRPLLWSTHSRGMMQRVFGRLFTELLGRSDVDFAQLTRRFHSRIYADMTLFGELLGRVGLPRNFFEALTRGDQASRHRGEAVRMVLRSPRLIRFVWRNGRVGAAIDAFLARHDRELEAFQAGDWGAADLPELLPRVESLLKLHGDTQWHVFTGAMNTTARHRLLQRLAARSAPQVASGDLTRGLPGLRALEPNLEIRRLAEEFGEFPPGLRELLAGGDDTAIRAALAETEAGRRLCRGMDALLHRFGHLAADGTDFTEPRWAEDPAPVWQAIARHLSPGATRPGCSDDRQSPSLVRERARSAARAAMGPFTCRVFDRLLASTSAYIDRRERLGEAMTQDAYQSRRLFLAIGDRLVSRGDLEHRDDVFLLYYDQLLALAGGRLEQASEVIRRRRAELAEDARLDPVESFCGDYPPVGSASLPTGDVLTGIPASAGLISGFARVVLTPADAPPALTGTDVLVVPFADVGWMPLLASVGAVVTESGGQLSHAAIVAREYGLPTVMSVTHATRLIREGQPLTVDGTRGVVYLKHLVPAHEPGSETR